MIQIQGLTAAFEDQSILKGIDLEVSPGEIHVLLGPNGSGKSTFGRVLLGDPKYQQTGGSVTFKGENWADTEPHERAQSGFFLSFQSPPEIDGVSVSDFLFAAKKALDPEFKSSFRFKKGLKEIFSALRLPEDFLSRETNLGFSGGERKKMEVTSMIALNPDLAFLDEIDSGVDIDTIRSIGESLRAFTASGEKALILVTHSDKLLQEITPTHVHVFTDGTIAQSGTKDLIQEIQEKGFDQYQEKKSLLKVLS